LLDRKREKNKGDYKMYHQVAIAVAAAATAPAVAAAPTYRIRDRLVQPASSFKAIKTGTKQAAVLQAIAVGASILDLAELVGSLSEAKHHLINLQANGIGTQVVSGTVTAIFPQGYALEDCFKKSQPTVLELAQTSAQAAQEEFEHTIPVAA
jgi:hypothetical protein